MQDQRIKSAIAIVENSNRPEALSVDRLAGSVKLSPSRFAHLFRAVTGHSPARYLKSVKLEKAAKLLATTGALVRDVAHRAGFSDRSHFVREFKRRYGVSPAQFRDRGYDGP
jgi:AraC family transcriptional regulator of arabinose operon